MQVGQNVPALSTVNDQEMVFGDRRGEYFCEIVAEAPDRLLCMEVPDADRRFSVGSFTPGSVEPIACQDIEAMDHLPEGFIDAKF